MKQKHTHTYTNTNKKTNKQTNKHTHKHTHTHTHTHTHQMYTKNVPYAKLFLPEKAFYSEERS